MQLELLLKYQSSSFLHHMQVVAYMKCGHVLPMSLAGKLILVFPEKGLE